MLREGAVADREGDKVTLTELVEQAHAHARSRGFWTPEAGTQSHVDERFASKLALVHSEISEAIEAYRERGLAGWQGDGGKPEGVPTELADAVIRIADLCGALGIDLEDAVTRKMAHNSTRPWRHGNKAL